MDLNQKHFEREARHHAAVAQHHHTIARAVKAAMCKSAKSDMETLDVESLAQLLDSFIESHAAIGDENLDFAEDCAKHAKAAGEAAVEAAEKSAAARFEKRDGQDAIVRDNVHGVAPPRSGLVAVPRPGMRDMAAAPVVSTQFEKLVAVDENNEVALQK